MEPMRTSWITSEVKAEDFDHFGVYASKAHTGSSIVFKKPSIAACLELASFCSGANVSKLKPMDIASFHVALRVHEFTLAQIKELFEEGCPHDKQNTFAAGVRGDKEFLEYLKTQGFTLNEVTCFGAALHGHLEALQWLREQGCAWDERVCHFAAQQGHLDVLKWAIENGAPCNRKELLLFAKPNIVNWLNKVGPEFL